MYPFLSLLKNDFEIHGPSTERSAISITETIKKKRKDINVIESYLTRADGSKKPLKRSTSEKNMNPLKQSSKPMKTQNSERMEFPSVQKGFVNIKKENCKIKNELKEIFNSKFNDFSPKSPFDRKYSKGNNSRIKTTPKTPKDYKDPLQLKEEAFRKEKIREKRLFRFYAFNRKNSSQEKKKESKKESEDDSTTVTISYYKVEEIDVSISKVNLG